MGAIILWAVCWLLVLAVIIGLEILGVIAVYLLLHKLKEFAVRRFFK